MKLFILKHYYEKEIYRIDLIFVKTKITIMKKHKRIQEKTALRNILKDVHADEYNNSFFFDYEDRTEYLEDCSCLNCLGLRMEILKQKLWEKHRNKPAVQKLDMFF